MHAFIRNRRQSLPGVHRADPLSETMPHMCCKIDQIAPFVICGIIVELDSSEP